MDLVCNLIFNILLIFRNQSSFSFTVFSKSSSIQQRFSAKPYSTASFGYFSLVSLWTAGFFLPPSICLDFVSFFPIGPEFDFEEVCLPFAVGGVEFPEQPNQLRLLGVMPMRLFFLACGCRESSKNNQQREDYCFHRKGWKDKAGTREPFSGLQNYSIFFQRFALLVR